MAVTLGKSWALRDDQSGYGKPPSWHRLRHFICSSKPRDVAIARHRSRRRPAYKSLALNGFGLDDNTISRVNPRFVVGAGMTGLLSAIKLREAGFTDITVRACCRPVMKSPFRFKATVFTRSATAQ